MAQVAQPTLRRQATGKPYHHMFLPRRAAKTSVTAGKGDEINRLMSILELDLKEKNLLPPR